MMATDRTRRRRSGGGRGEVRRRLPGRGERRSIAVTSLLASTAALLLWVGNDDGDGGGGAPLPDGAAVGAGTARGRRRAAAPPSVLADLLSLIDGGVAVAEDEEGEVSVPPAEGAPESAAPVVVPDVPPRPGRPSRLGAPPEASAPAPPPEAVAGRAAPSAPPEPSHIAVCRHVLRPESDRPPSTYPAVVEESDAACSDPNAPHASLMRALASSLVAHAFDRLVSYGPNCRSRFHRRGGDVGSATALRALPDRLPPLLDPDPTAAAAGEVRDRIRAACRACVDSADGGPVAPGPTSPFSDPECVLLGAGAAGAATLLHNAVPSVGGVMEELAEEWRRMRGGNDGGEGDGGDAALPALGAGEGAVAPSSDAAAPTAASRLEAEEEEDGAVIYLSCADDACHRDAGGDVVAPPLALPVYYYASRIPPSAPAITVMTSPSCSSSVPACDDHGLALSDELRGLYPRASVSFRSAASGAEAYGRMARAGHLVCPPGVSCLLPALARGAGGGSMKSTSVVDDDAMYPYFRPLRDAFAPSVALVPGGAFPVLALGRSAEGGAGDLVPFLRQMPPPGSKVCRLLRGRSGWWVRDVEYAGGAQYATPLRRYERMRFEPTTDRPYAASSTYRWEDDLCPISLTTREGLCDVLERKRIRRVLVVGDSLSLQFVESLWKLLGSTDNPEPRKAKDRSTGWTPWSRYQWTRRVDCPGAADRGFELSYTRNDLLNAETKPLHFERWGQDYNCGTYSYCFPWLRQYKDYNGPGHTLLIANLGSHLHSDADFDSALDEFARTLRLNHKPHDIVMFRTTVPGHAGCQDPGVRPLTSHDEFVKTLPEDDRSWHLFSGYNDRAQRAFRELDDEADGASVAPHVDVLDVYPMTVLRPDGHGGGPEGCERCKADDCLHYTLPGPPDFWVHLMYSNLLDMASEP